MYILYIHTYIYINTHTNIYTSNLQMFFIIYCVIVTTQLISRENQLHNETSRFYHVSMLVRVCEC